MRRPLRWIIAAAVAVLVVALLSPAGNARSHRRAPASDHPSSRAVQPSPSQAPGTGMSDTGAVARSEQGGGGKSGTSVATLDPHDVMVVLGKSVRSRSGEDMGRLVDLVVDRDGRPRAAIIDFGGFLGVGSRKIAVDWAALTFSPTDQKGNVITVELTRDQVKAAPEFKEGNPVVVLGVPALPQPTQATPPQAQEK
jgi:hypothetical protein